MANNLIPEELQALIAQYLTDGVLTSKEREVILKKAEAMGLDRDEIDLYLEAEVQKIDQATDAAVRKQKGKQCPFCGASIPVLTDKCPECGGSITPEADKELEEILENLEEALVDFKSGKDFEKSKATVERYVRKAELYYSSNPKIKILLEQVRKESELAAANAKKKARMNTIGKVLTYNKWLTTIVVLVIIGGIGALVVSIKDDMKGPDLTQDAEACITAMYKAIEEKDFAKAEGLYNNYQNGTYDLKDAKIALALAYVEEDNVEKAVSLMHWESNRRPVVRAILKKGYYNEAWDLDSGYEEACEIIDAMRENGDDAKIEPFVKKTIGYFGDHSSSKYWKLRDYAGLK